jgi:hypothetical protein
MTELLDVFDAIPRVPGFPLDDRWRRSQTRDFKRIPPSQYIDGWRERARHFGETRHRLAEERCCRGTLPTSTTTSTAPTASGRAR